MSEIIQGNSQTCIAEITSTVDLTFLDPPFNQGKQYDYHDDNMSDDDYWEMMKDICGDIFDVTSIGGSLYFMQREKNCENVLRIIREVGWKLQNIIIWKKFTSAAAPSNFRHAKGYQIIVYATKGDRPKTFNKLRIISILSHHKYERENGMFVTDYWDDIKELTAGYFSTDEVILCEDGKTRFHKQQSPLALLTRIVLTSSKVGDLILDPFAGTGTTACVATQLKRNYIVIDIDPKNAKCIEGRVKQVKPSDDISKYKKDYSCTNDLDAIWG